MNCYLKMVLILVFVLELCSRVVNDYTQSVRNLACDILDLVGEGLGVSDKFSFSRLIRDVHNDSLLRLNHYPPVSQSQWDPHQHSSETIGFGEHSDPQILTILRSNDVAGLQIFLHDHGLWVPVPADPDNFYVFVGDVLEVYIVDNLFTQLSF